MRVNQSSSTSVGGLRTGSSGFGFVIIGSSNSWALATYLPAGQATDSIRANDLPGSSPGDFCRGALLNRRVLETASSKGCASSGRLLPGSPSLRPIAGLRSCPPGPRHNLGLVVAHNVSLEDLGSGSMQAPFALSSRPRRVRTTVKDVEVRYESIGGGYDLARELVPRIAGRLATGTLRAAGCRLGVRRRMVVGGATPAGVNSAGSRMPGLRPSPARRDRYLRSPSGGVDWCSFESRGSCPRDHTEENQTVRPILPGGYGWT